MYDLPVRCYLQTIYFFVMTFQFEYDNSHKTVAAGNVWDLSIVLTLGEMSCQLNVQPSCHRGNGLHYTLNRKLFLWPQSQYGFCEEEQVSFPEEKSKFDSLITHSVCRLSYPNHIC
jgi:hypothetical protein